MILSEKLLLSDPDSGDVWKQVLLHRKKKPSLYVICIHPEHVYPAEIMESREFYKADAADIRYQVIGIADGYSSAVSLFQKAVEEVLAVDPELRQLKTKLQEIYV